MLLRLFAGAFVVALLVMAVVAAGAMGALNHDTAFWVALAVFLVGCTVLGVVGLVLGYKMYPRKKTPHIEPKRGTP
jgi:hypothetical protein